MAGELSSQGISILSACPGPTKTPMTASAGMPWPLGLVARYFFNPPSVGADRLYRAAFDSPGVASGSFLIKGKVTLLPHAHAAQAVLERVSAIYRQEFAAAAQGGPSGTASVVR
ncbi:hypothetical protein ACLEPN_02300 [Myxococcus sp. 1LA]